MEEGGKKKKHNVKKKNKGQFELLDTQVSHNTAVMQGNRPISVQNWPMCLTSQSSANVTL